MNALQIIWSVISSRVLAEVIVLLSLPLLNSYAVYRVLLAVYNAGKPREVAVAG